ncbi:MAG: hypothetical protein R3D52_07320 [Xanthobacteraceae bacterium]
MEFSTIMVNGSTKMLDDAHSLILTASSVLRPRGGSDWQKSRIGARRVRSPAPDWFTSMGVQQFQRIGASGAGAFPNFHPVPQHFGATAHTYLGQEDIRVMPKLAHRARGVN